MISTMVPFKTLAGDEINLSLDRNSIFFRCVEDSNDAIMISDRKGQLVYVNPSWQRVYGYSESEALGQTPRLLHSGTQDPQFYREMWARIGNPSLGHWKGELINRAKDGSLIPVLLSITPYKSEEGEILGYMGVAVDVSWRREMEAKIVHQDRLATIGTLVSGLAHEVGTPLGVIRGRAEFLQMQSENGVIRRSVEVILSQSDRISRIIQSLLKLSRGSEERARLEAVSVSEISLEIISLLSGPLKSSHVEARVEGDSSLRVFADLARLEQVLMNLVVNAVHAMDSGDRRNLEDPRTVILRVQPCVSCEPGLWAEIQVEDNGCGIPRENLKKIFQPFYTTKEVGQGTGLGLPISQKLMQEMGGSMDVKSEPGRGTTFSLRLKLVPPRAV